MARVNPCVKELPEVIPENTCNWCGYTLKHTASYRRHLTTCVAKKNRNKIRKIQRDKLKAEQVQKDRNDKIQKDNDDKMEQLLEQMEQMREQFTEMMEQMRQGVAVKDPPVQVNNYISPYIVNGNVIINSIDKPNTDFIDAKFVEELADKHHTMTPLYLTLDTYFNPERPENHSIHITNAVTKDGMIWMGNGWRAVPAISTKGHVDFILRNGFTNTIKYLRVIEKYKDGKLVREICNIRSDDRSFDAHSRQLLQSAIDVFKRHKITPDFINQSIERGRSGDAADDDVIDEIVVNDIVNGKEEAD